MSCECISPTALRLLDAVFAKDTNAQIQRGLYARIGLDFRNRNQGDISGATANGLGSLAQSR